MADVIVALVSSLVLAFVVAGPKARRSPATVQAAVTPKAGKK